MQSRLSVTIVTIAGALILAFCFASVIPASAQQPAIKGAQVSAAPTVVRALTKEESEKWTILAQAEAIYNGTINKIVAESVKLAVSADTSREVHTAIKEAFNTYTLATSERRGFIAQLRLEANCRECIIQDGSLIRPAPEPANKQ